MRCLILSAFLIFSAPAAWANAKITVLMDALQIVDSVEILREEGFAYAETLDKDMLNGAGGAFWDAQMRQIYNAEQISERLRLALEDGLSPEDLDATLAFFNTERGTRIITLENAARRAMADPVVEEAANDVYASLSGTDDERLALVTTFIASNDLLERNVSGSMNSYVQFYAGLSDGRFRDMSEDMILSQVWEQQDAIRADTEVWIYSYLLLAYQPLPLSDLEAYVAYAQTDAGQALNAALFEGFEAVYNDISYALGRAVALSADGDEI